ncbi:MAG: hypothetical protein HOI95_02515 [Chromatiales bacterium]|jgi:hypothetical protein|nr:hypothetical protein [Chromatiales bacterium]
MCLGATVFTVERLHSESRFVDVVRRALTHDGVVQIYGCEFGGTADGSALLQA